MLKYTRRRTELAAARVPHARLVCLLGGGSFAWVLDSSLLPHDDGPQAAANVAALAAYGAARRGSSRVGAQARRASRQLAERDDFLPPWSAESDSEADEAAAAASDAARAAAGSAAADAAAVAAALAETASRDGLTPDWIIDAGCDIFGLRRPCAAQPIIQGLCDPWCAIGSRVADGFALTECPHLFTAYLSCNNKRNPNIPAAVLYDKQDDGLAVRNSWAGHFVILNPPYEAAVQWRCVHAAPAPAHGTGVMPATHTSACAQFHQPRHQRGRVGPCQGRAACMPQQHRHRVLPAVAPLPARAAAPRRHPLQGLP